MEKYNAHNLKKENFSDAFCQTNLTLSECRCDVHCWWHVCFVSFLFFNQHFTSIFVYFSFASITVEFSQINHFNIFFLALSKY